MRRFAIVLAAGLTLLLSPICSGAIVTYDLVDYPTLQTGDLGDWNLSGTISVDLPNNEVTEWQFTLTNGTIVIDADSTHVGAFYNFHGVGSHLADTPSGLVLVSGGGWFQLYDPLVVVGDSLGISLVWGISGGRYDASTSAGDTQYLWLAPDVGEPPHTIVIGTVAEPAVVPEPASLLVFAGLGMCLAAGAWRKRRKRAA